MYKNLRVAMAQTFVLCLVVVLGTLASVVRTQGTEWEEYTPYWCTPVGRVLMSRGTTVKECKSYCNEGCGAIEWWEGGGQACYLCTDLSLLIEFPYTRDLSYPPHVFIKQSDVQATPTTIAITIATTSTAVTSDEGIPTTTPDEIKTTSSMEEIFPTMFPIDEDDISSTPDEEGTTSAATDGEDIASTPFLVSTPATEQEKTSAVYQEGTTASPEMTTSAPSVEGTTATPEGTTTRSAVEGDGTVSEPDHRITTSALNLQQTTTSPFHGGSTSTTNEESTTKEAEQEMTTLSPIQESTASAVDLQTTTSAPEHERPTSKPEVEGTNTGKEETTPSPGQEVKTSELDPVAKDPEKETSLPNKEATTTLPEKGASTSVPELEWTTLSPQPGRKTYAPDHQGATPESHEDMTSSPSSQEATTSGPELIKTTSAPNKEGSTSATRQEGTISLLQQEGTTSAIKAVPPTSEKQQEGTSSEPSEQVTTIPQGQEFSTSSYKGITPEPKEERTTVTHPEKKMTISNEGKTNSAKEGGTSSTPTESHSIRSPMTLPGVPVEVSSKTISETELELSWMPPHEGRANILFYRVKVIDVSGGGLTRIIQVPQYVQSVTVDSLNPDTKYLFAVSAGNQHGIGPLSEEMSGRTKAIIARIEPTKDTEVQSTSQEEPVVRLSHSTDFVVAGMDKSTRAICFVSGQEFIGWFKSTGEQIIGTSPNHRMYVEDEDDSYSLVIRRLMQSDGGEYVCRGTKTSATYSLYVEFSVEDPPDVQNLWLNQEGEIFVGVKIGYPAPEYLWQKNGVKLDANSGRFRLLPDGTIKISKVSAEDAGDYKVRISQLNRRRETTETIKVRIFDPPQIDTTKPAERNLTFGYPTTLECLVSGIPKPEVTWTGPNGETVTGSEQRISFQSDGSLKIFQVNLMDMGRWTCEAINSVGSASRQIEVQAIYMPPEIHQLSNITANEGDSKSLKCTATGFPLPKVIWLRDNKEYPGQMKKPGESVLNLEDLGLDDISKFICEASNAATDEEGEIIVKTVAVDLFVMVEPRPYDSNLVKEPVYSELGSPVPVRLACAFTGYPPPEVRITKDDDSVVNGIESVWIDIVTDSLDDYGVYHCVAENVVSLSKLNYTFEVKRSEAPKFTLEPKVPSGNLTAGFPVTMTWNVSGIPKPEMRWKSPSEGYVTLINPRFLLSQRNLTIKTLEEKDAGIWTIEATNSLKTTKVQVEFGTIFVPPQIKPIPDVVAYEGENTTLTCTASGVPTPDVKWISEGKEFFDEQKSPGKSEITLLNLGLEDNSQFICQAKNGAQDDKGKELVDVQSMKLIVKVEPKPADSTHRAKPVLSYIGNPEPSVFNCEFSGYPPPDVRILKDGQVLAYGEDSLSYSVSVDSVDDFGEYICMAENEVGKSKKNYTFEIRSSAAPSSPRDFTGEPTCDSVVLSWSHPDDSGGFPVISYVITYSNNTVVISSDLTDFIIDNLKHGTKYKIGLQARTEAGIGKEANVEVKTTQFCQVSSCVNVLEDGDLYTLNASQGLWPRDGFCRALSAHRASEPDMYRLSADYYIPGTKGSMVVTYVGVFFNAQNEDNFDFIFFRVGASDNPCFQTGEIQRGRLNWYGSQVGSCPHGPPRNARWIHITLEVRKSEVSVFLEGVHVTSFRGHFPPKGAGGVLLANRRGSVVRFKNFIINDIPSLPFETNSCATMQDNTKYYSMISQGDFWSQGFCRALLKNVNLEETSTYQVSVDLFSDLGWSGDRIAYLGIIFNARDINNADFIYFRPYWKDHCYQTGYMMGGRQRREGAKTGPCSCTVAGGKWFNVRLEIRSNIVSVFMNGLAAATFKSHFPSTNKGTGVLVTGGCRKSIRFRNFTVKSLPLLPFTSKNCQGARDSGSYFTLMAYPGIEDTTQPGVCRAVYPKNVLGTSYVISVSFYVQGSLLGGKYGVMFNVKNADSFEFVYFRPYNRDDCVQIGYLQGTKINEGERRKPKSLTCSYGFMRGGSWYDVRLKVNGSEVKVLIDDVVVAVFKSRFPTIGRGGVMVASGYKRRINFKDFRIL